MKNLRKIDKYIIVTFGLFGFLFWHFAKEMLQIRQAGWYAGHVNLYGDLVFHLSLINKFLSSGKILIDNPIFAQDKINYPIFADYMTAIVSRIVGIDFALFITTFFGGILLIFTARIFILNFIRNEKIVFISLLLFFLNGGFGFYYFFKDYLVSGQPLLSFLVDLPREYTNIQREGFWWMNNFLAYFLPQRGFLFAFPITLVILSLVYIGWRGNKRVVFILAGLLTGILPLVQGHSLFVLFVLFIFYAPISVLFSKYKKSTLLNWLIFALLTIVISWSIFQTISSIENPIRFVRFDPGWTSEENIFWFWFKNLGLFAPMLIISLIWLLKKRLLFILYLPFLIIFFLSNIFVFQPWDFDNSKLLVYWYFASSIVVAYFLYDELFSENITRKFVGVAVVVIMIFSGAIDVFRTFTPVTNHQIFSRKDLEVAESVKNLTPKNSIFITASNHNHPIPALTGRSTLLGFYGWVWSHGLDYQERARDIISIYSGGSQAEQLIAKYRVSYVSYGPLEKSSFRINGKYFNNFPRISLGNGWEIYDVSHLWADNNRED